MSTKLVKSSSSQAVLRLGSINVVSAARTAFVFSLAFSVVMFLLILMLYMFLNFAGVFSVSAVGGTSEGASADFTLSNAISPWTVLIFSLILAGTNVFTFTTGAIIFSVIYNVIARITGGLRFTFYR